MVVFLLVSSCVRPEGVRSYVTMASSTTKHDIQKFDGSDDFSVLKMKMLALLGNLGLDEALAGEARMPTSYTEEKKEIMKKAYKTIILSFGDKVLREVSKMKTAKIFG